jgi:hypothetical protein
VFNERFYIKANTDINPLNFTISFDISPNLPTGVVFTYGSGILNYPGIHMTYNYKGNLQVSRIMFYRPFPDIASNKQYDIIRSQVPTFDMEYMISNGLVCRNLTTNYHSVIFSIKQVDCAHKFSLIIDGIPTEVDFPIRKDIFNGSSLLFGGTQWLNKFCGDITNIKVDGKLVESFDYVNK